MSDFHSSIKNSLKSIILLATLGQIIISSPINASDQRNLQQSQSSSQSNLQSQKPPLMQGARVRGTSSSTPNLRSPQQHHPLTSHVRSHSQPQNVRVQQAAPSKKQSSNTLDTAASSQLSIQKTAIVKAVQSQPQPVQAQQMSSLKGGRLEVPDNTPSPQLIIPEASILNPAQPQNAPIPTPQQTQSNLSLASFENFAENLGKLRSKNNESIDTGIALQRVYEANFHLSFVLAAALRKNLENNTQVPEEKLIGVEKLLLARLAELKVAHEKAGSNEIYETIVGRILPGFNINSNNLSDHIFTKDLKLNSILLLMSDKDLQSYVMLMSECFNNSHEDKDTQGLENKFTLFLEEVTHRKLNILPPHLAPLLQNLERFKSSREHHKLIVALLNNIWSPSIFQPDSFLEAEAEPRGTFPLTLQNLDVISDQYYFIGNTKTALEVIEYALTDIKNQQAPSDQLRIYRRAGFLYYKEQKYEEAKTYYQNALEIEIEDSLILTIRDYINLAHASYKLENPEEEVKSLVKQASDKFNAQENKQSEDAFMLSRIWMKSGDIGYALFYLGISFSLKENSKEVMKAPNFQLEMQEKLKEIMKMSKPSILYTEGKQDKGKSSRKKRQLETSKGKEKDGDEHKSESPKKKQKLNDKKNKEEDAEEPIDLESVASKTNKKRLMLGEADFSFTVALIKKHDENYPLLKKNITATEFQEESSLRRVYRDTFPENFKFLNNKGVKVEFGIDARKIHEHYKGRHFDRIHFNYPHDRSSFDAQTLPKLIEQFFESATHLQDIGDRINIALPHFQKDADNMFRQGYVYKIYRGSVTSGYKYTHKRPFNDERYPGYNHRKTGEATSVKGTESGREYIFEKQALTEEGKESIRQEHPPRKYSSSKGTLEALPLFDTQNESSADY